MGAGQSTSQAHPPTRALHVLRVTPSSPASETNIEPFFDFVVGFEGDTLPSSQNNIDASQLEKIVEQHEGKVLNLLVWNSKNKDTRGMFLSLVPGALTLTINCIHQVVPITPSRAWSSSSSLITDTKADDPNAQPSLLGLSMRMCEP